MTLTGAAQDAKGGAVVVADDGRVVYLDGLAAWPDAVAGRRVTVTGRLVERVQAEPLVNDAGEHAAGASGPQWILEAPRWSPAEP